jgi:hypothetical protein
MTKEQNPMKTLYGKVLWAIAASAMIATAALAGTGERVGTGGNSEGRLLVGARSVGLSYANLSSVTGVEALFGNPAGMVGTENAAEVLFSHADYIADMKLNYIAVAKRLGNTGSIGFSAKVLSVGDIIRTTEAAPDGTGDVFSPTFTTLGLSYARALTDRTNFGGTVHLISESVMQTHATGFSFDFGFQYDTGYRGIRVAAALQNFGPAQTFAGTNFDRNFLFPEDNPQAANRTVSLSSSESELPTLFAGSFSWPVVRGVNSVTVHGVYQSNSFNVDEFRGGLEYGWRKDFALRLGYKLTSDSNELFGLTYGLGVKLPLGGSDMQLDYAGQSVSDYFDDVQHVGLTFHF